MGLFDRLKKAFQKEKKQEEPKSAAEQTHHEDDQQSVQEEVQSEVAATDNAEEITPSDTETAEMEPVTDDADGSAPSSAEEVVVEEDHIDGVATAEKELPKGEESAPVAVEEDKENKIEEIAKTAEESAVKEEITVEESAPEEAATEEVIQSETKAETATEQGTIKIKTIDDEAESTTTDERYDKGLAKTRQTFGEKMNALFANFRRVDEAFFEDLEDTLITSDVGFETAMRLTDELREEVKLKNAKKVSDIQNVIIEKLVDLYDQQGEEEDNAIHLKKNGLSIILFVGVNGAGKTTTIGKLAHQFTEQGKKVILAAADTFRAGAIDQLVVWGERTGVEVVRGKEGGDPASVVFDAVKKAKAENADILLVDTAGRLQNKVNLMNELEKIKRILQREEPDAPQEVLLVLDATTGQNAMSQAKQFKETTDVTGLVLTKLDGTAKGGMILAIRNELHIPVKLVGLGEGINDLATFDPEKFAYGLFKGLWK